jgi:hypothetical protein
LSAVTVSRLLPLTVTVTGSRLTAKAEGGSTDTTTGAGGMPAGSKGQALESEEPVVPLFCTKTSPGPAAAGTVTTICVPPPVEETLVSLTKGSVPTRSRSRW